MKPERGSGRIPAKLLAKLKCSKVKNLPLDPDVMAEIALLIGLNPIGGTWWNHTIDYLDGNHPGWRGYEVVYSSGKKG